MRLEKNVLVIGEDKDFIDFLALLLEGEYQYNVIETSDPIEAKRFIENHTKPLVCIINTTPTSCIEEGSIYLSNRTMASVPYVHVVDAADIDELELDKYKNFFSHSEYNFLLPSQTAHKHIVKICDKVEKRFDLADDKEEFKTKDGQELFRIKIRRYLAKSKAASDIYIKIGAGKFLKLIKAGEAIDRVKIMEYYSKGEKFLFQSKADYDADINAKMDKLVKGFKKANLSKAEHIGLQLETIKEVQDVVRNMGISEKVIKSTDEVVGSIEAVLKDSKNLKKLIKNLLQLKSKFFTRTSIMNYLLGAMKEQLSWCTHKTFKKLVYASVFCDFGFEMDEVQLAFILSLKEKKATEITSFEKRKIKNHAKLSAAFLEKTDSFLTDEISLILQHHEKPDGTGIPQGLNYKTTPLLSCMFILVYDFTTRLVLSCDSVEDLNPGEIFLDLPEEYKLGNYKQPYDALKEALKI
ncbi:MAG: HD domain-containing phosphohydrolase [Bacteriovoracaceae bacterium]